MTKLLLNCDLGEKVHDNDALIMPYIDQANIACGLHASDPYTMVKTIRLAAKHKVSVGAHPSYPDRENFGRVSVKLETQELRSIIQYQLAAFIHLCTFNNVTVDYVKPHGAMYNDMMKNVDLFATICQSIAEVLSNTSIMVQALPEIKKFTTIAKHFGLSVITEAFADRNYQDNGLLVARTKTNAIIEDHHTIKTNIQLLLQERTLASVSGQPLALSVESLCVHGDNAQALTLVKNLRQLIDVHNE